MALSYSQLSTYRRCPRQYEYACVKKIGRPISDGESFGSSLHNTLRKFGLLELEKQGTVSRPLTLFTEDHPHDQSLDLTLTTLLSLWRQSFIAEGYGSRAEMDARFRDGEEALRHYFRWWQSVKRNVLAIEKGFSLPVPETEGLKLTGRFDRVERTDGGITVIDYKSSGPRPEATLATDLQLSVYAIAAEEMWDEPVHSLMILSVTAEGITEQTTTRTKAELRDALKSIRILAERIGSKEYGPTPAPDLCRHCPYRDICAARAV